jgi:hypothetical protein
MATNNSINSSHPFATADIAASAVTYAKIQNMSASTLLGNPTGGSAAPEEITLGTNLSFAGTVLNASGGTVSPLTTKGDLWGYDSTNNRIPVGSNTQNIYADSSQSLGVAYDFYRNQKSNTVCYFNDFTQSTGADGLGTPLINASGTGAGNTNTTTTQGSNGNRLGVNLMSVGTTNTGNIYCVFTSTNSSAGNYWYPSYGQMIYEINMQITQLSNGSDRFNLYLGFTDAHVDASVANGIYFHYEDDLNSGKWQLIGNTASTPTTTNSTSTVDTSWHRYKIVVNAAATLATFYIDDTSVGTVATLPTTNLAPIMLFTKTVGTTACTVSVDWTFCRKDFTTPR